MKRIIAAALAAVLVATSAPAVGNAANVEVKALGANVSVQEADQAKFDKGEVVVVTDAGIEESVKAEGDVVTVTAVKSSKKTVKIAGQVNGKAVTKISSKAFKNCKKAKKIDLTDVELVELKSNQFKGAKKAKTIKINAKKLKAGKISAKALKGFKGKKIVLSGVSKKTFKKLVKKLKKSAAQNVVFERD